MCQKRVRGKQTDIARRTNYVSELISEDKAKMPRARAPSALLLFAVSHVAARGPPAPRGARPPPLLAACGDTHRHAPCPWLSICGNRAMPSTCCLRRLRRMGVRVVYTSRISACPHIADGVSRGWGQKKDFNDNRKLGTGDTATGTAHGARARGRVARGAGRSRRGRPDPERRGAPRHRMVRGRCEDDVDHINS